MVDSSHRKLQVSTKAGQDHAMNVTPCSDTRGGSFIAMAWCCVMVCGCSTSGAARYPADWPGTLLTQPDCAGIEGTFADACGGASLGDEGEYLCRLSLALTRPVLDTYPTAVHDEFASVKSVRLARTDGGGLEVTLFDGAEEPAIVRRSVIDLGPEPCTDEGLELARWDGGVVPVMPIVWGLARERWLLASNSEGELVLHLDSNGAYVVLVIPRQLRTHAWVRWRRVTDH
jgi:hypothetical protein